MAPSKRTSKAGEPETKRKRAGPISLHGLDFDDVMRRMLRFKVERKVRKKRPLRKDI